VKKKTDNAHAKALRSNSAQIQDPSNGVHMTVDLAKLKNHKLVAVGKQDQYLAHAKCEELAMNAILLGSEYKNVRRLLLERVTDLLNALRESLPSGRECKIAVVEEDGNKSVYSWFEFCLRFFWGVGEHNSPRG